MDIVLLFGYREEMALGIEYLQSFSKVPRFNMIIMCLSPSDKAGMSFIFYLQWYLLLSFKQYYKICFVVMLYGTNKLTKTSKVALVAVLLQYICQAHVYLKTDLSKIWNEVFSKGTAEYAEILGNLRPKYGISQ